MTKHWAAEFIGRPWSPTFNCWSLVREVFLVRWGVEMPELGVGEVHAADNVALLKAAAEVSGWRPADGPAQDGDIVLCRDLTGKRHVGVMIEQRGCLLLMHNEGYMSLRKGVSVPIGSVLAQLLHEAIQLTEIELWRRA